MKAQVGTIPLDLPRAMVKTQELFIPQALAGAITRYSYFVEGMADWAALNPASPPKVGLGKAFWLRVYWRNTGTVSCRGSSSVQITKPDGSKLMLTSYFTQPVELAAGYETYFQFYGFTLDKVGTYSAKIDLYGEEVPVAVGIEVHIINYPANSYMWEPLIYVPTKTNTSLFIGPPRFLYMYEYLVYPYTVGGVSVSAEMDVFVIDSAFQWIYTRLAVPVTIGNGKRYRWNCSTHRLEVF